MTKRVAALIALVAFATAWLVGVAYGHAPMTRLENAALALIAAFVAGLGIGVALERIVLARLSESWRETKTDASAGGESFAPAAPAALAVAAKEPAVPVGTER